MLTKFIIGPTGLCPCQSGTKGSTIYACSLTTEHLLQLCQLHDVPELLGYG